MRSTSRIACFPGLGQGKGLPVAQRAALTVRGRYRFDISLSPSMLPFQAYICVSCRRGLGRRLWCASSVSRGGQFAPASSSRHDVSFHLRSTPPFALAPPFDTRLGGIMIGLKDWLIRRTAPWWMLPREGLRRAGRVGWAQRLRIAAGTFTRMRSVGGAIKIKSETEY